MKLGNKQEVFSGALSLLLHFAAFHGYEVRMGQVTRTKEEAERLGFPKSLHTVRLAADINLFRDGKYLKKTSDHLLLGRFWESLSGKYEGSSLKFCWGGRFNDGNHYSLQHGGVK